MRKDIASKTRIESRLTDEEKVAIKEQAAKRNMTVSEFVRFACEKIFQEEKK